MAAIPAANSATPTRDMTAISLEARRIVRSHANDKASNEAGGAGRADDADCDPRTYRPRTLEQHHSEYRPASGAERHSNRDLAGSSSHSEGRDPKTPRPANAAETIAIPANRRAVRRRLPSGRIRALRIVCTS